MPHHSTHTLALKKPDSICWESSFGVSVWYRLKRIQDVFVTLAAEICRVHPDILQANFLSLTVCTPQRLLPMGFVITLQGPFIVGLMLHI